MIYIYIYIYICLVGVIRCYSYPSEKSWSESQLGYVGMMIPNNYRESHKIPWFQSPPTSICH